MITLIISTILGVLIGAVMGLTGAGGGSLAVPALVGTMGWSMQQAMPVALLAVTGGAAVGALEGLRKKLVRYRAATVMALAGMPFTAVGVSVAKLLSQQKLLMIFSCVLVLIAVRFLKQSRGGTGNDAPQHSVVCRINAETGRFVWTWATGLTIGAIGCLAGFATGLLGVGGGFVIVPMLRRFTNVSMHGAVATSLLVIALVGSAGVASAIWHGGSLPLSFSALFLAATVGGMLGGRVLARHLSAQFVQAAFAMVLLFVAAGMFFKALA